MSDYQNLLSRLRAKVGPIALDEIEKLLEFNELPADAIGPGSVPRLVAEKLGDVVSAKDFGVDPGKADNTQELQNAIDYLASRVTSGATIGGGVLFIPAGYYRFKFTAGTSGLPTITIPCDGITICGDGRATTLTVRSPDTRVTNFFTWQQIGLRGNYGGIRDLIIDGNGQLDWAVFLDSWRFWQMANVGTTDLYGGILDAACGQTVFGEHISVHNVDYICSSASTNRLTEYGVRFRSTAVGMWTDSSIRNVLVVGGWHAAVIIDGCQRIAVDEARIGWSGTSSNTIDGTSRTGVKNGVILTNTVLSASTTDVGMHRVTGVYFESHAGSENTTDNTAVLIDNTVSGTIQRFNRVYDVCVSYGNGPGLFLINNSTGVDGAVLDNFFTGNRRAITTNQIIVGSVVRRTELRLASNSVALSQILDTGIDTIINGTLVRNFSGATFPSTTLSAGWGDVGFFVQDSGTGRVCWFDKSGTPRIVGPVPAIDVVSPYGSNRIQSLPTPGAPTIAVSSVGSTTWTYYVVAIDKDGNESVPGPSGSVSNGPASLAGSARNRVSWAPVPGAVGYRLLRGDTSHYVATNIRNTYYEDNASSTSAYSPASTNPTGKLTVDGALKAGILDADSYTAAQLGDIAHAVNTTGKVAKRFVYNSTSNRFMHATGSSADSTWVDLAGANTITPA